MKSNLDSSALSVLEKEVIKIIRANDCVIGRVVFPDLIYLRPSTLSALKAKGIIQEYLTIVPTESKKKVIISALTERGKNIKIN